MSKHTPGAWFFSELGSEIIAMPTQVKVCSRISGNDYNEAMANGN